MRGSDQVTGSLFSYVDLEERIPARHPLRKIRAVVNDALRSLDAEFNRLPGSRHNTKGPPPADGGLDHFSDAGSYSAAIRSTCAVHSIT